ncbi:amidohydrolase family protein [Collinsella sp. AF31-11]|uniref:amidohydrolase family protein n=1 Tax=Collinsella sp. AF31-11 TaxID=2292011 RepID=UPI000E4A5812|nr:amidohydrolase family protein [Collinsella sp. AF31-11]RHN22794.1 hypothetical protein DWZ22_03885 [Collinsella sp. AF31-11]
MLLVANGSVFTRNAQTPFIPNGAVAIDGDTIVEVGPECELKAKYPDAEYVDAQGNLIMPGLINCHTHIYSGLARDLAIKGCNPTNFLENLEQQWWKIDDNLTLAGTKASAYATILDSIRDGVTTIFDHHASFCEIPGSLFTIKDAAQELVMRSCLCYEVSDRRGQEKCDQAIAENAEFAQWAAKECRDNDNHMIAAMPNVGWCEAMTMLFENNVKMASKYFDRKLDVLEPGAAADVIVMDYKPFTPLSEENIDGHMLFGMMGKNCRTTIIINGRVLYKDREFVGIDEDKISAWAMAESKKLWSTLNDRAY